MKCGVLLLGCLTVMFAAGEVYAGDDPNQGASPPIALQQSLATPTPDTTLQSLEIAPQTGSERMLEIAPQPGNADPQRAVDDAKREFKPSDNVATIDRNFRTDEQSEGRAPLEVSNQRRPLSLGAIIQYQTRCYLGAEEQGFEVVSIDPGGAAERAGLHGKTPASPVAVAGVAAGFALGPASPIVNRLIAKSGALGSGGDLIVAIDDVRVRDVREFRRAIRDLRPGDSVYLTVIRPFPGGGHRTMKIKVQLDEMPQPPSGAPLPGAATVATNQ